MKNNCTIFLYFFFILLQSDFLFAKEVDISEFEHLKKRLEVLEKEISNNKNSTKSNEEISLKSFFVKNSENFNATFDGRFVLDSGFATKDANSNSNSATSLRRLWLGTFINVGEDWTYRFLVGFDKSSNSVIDAFVNYHGIKNIDIIAGNFFENNGVDISTINTITPLMERSLAITTFKPLRRVGVSINPYGENWGMHFGFFGSELNNSGAKKYGEGFASRAHIAVINDKKNSQILHLGYNNSYRTPDLENNSMRFSSNGTSDVIGNKLVDTGVIYAVDDYTQNMAEILYQNGSFNFASEYVRTDIKRKNNDNLSFHGGYILASYFLTKEKYDYDVKSGAPLPAKVKNGAIEVAGRISMVNLDDTDIQGGKLESYDFGINYYLNSYVKFMVNYNINKISNQNDKKTNPQYLMLRMQASF